MDDSPPGAVPFGKAVLVATKDALASNVDEIIYETSSECE